MKKLILLLGCFILFLSFNLSLFSQEKFFKNPKNTYLISTDLHIHTVFSDGFVWPDLRVDEALREGLDLISITDHLEYQPHKVIYFTIKIAQLTIQFIGIWIFIEGGF